MKCLAVRFTYGGVTRGRGHRDGGAQAGFALRDKEAAVGAFTLLFELGTMPCYIVEPTKEVSRAIQIRNRNPALRLSHGLEGSAKVSFDCSLFPR